jgi:TetR/AcrR family transcriptional regulator, mexJK operon transcriptional repressor
MKIERKERSRPKHAAILQAAAELFVEHGFDGASTEMIAEKAGVSRQTIYNQFETKQALFLAIASELVQTVIEPLSQGVEGPSDLRQTLLALGQRLLDTVLCPKVVALHRMTICEALRFPGLAQALYEAGPVRAEHEVAAYLSGRSELNVPDPKLAARQFLALTVHPLDLRALLGSRAETVSPEIAQHLGAAVDTFLKSFSRVATAREDR